ncbi:MAG: T9SS type A sorting domain-containing protein [bacterium]
MIKIIFLILIALGISYTELSAQIIAPSDLEAESEDSSYIKVKWDDNSSNEDGFYIERTQSLLLADWEIIDAVAQNRDQYFDYWVTRGIRYYYRVYAFNGQGVSGYSNVDSAILEGDPNVIPSTPSNLRPLDISPTSISMEWNDNAVNEIGFIIARKGPDDVFFQYIDTVAADVLTYQEVGLTPDRIYLYKVCSFNVHGISDYSNNISARTKKSTLIVHNYETIPAKYFLNHNYPNPFNPVTNIKFGITDRAFVKLKIYNSLGREIETLIGQSLPAGTYEVSWDAKNHTSGVYFYTIETNSFTDIKKMILIK